MKFFIVLFVLLSSLNAIVYDESLKILDSLKQEAIVLGDGKNEVSVFVDPLCPHSRDFIEMIESSTKMKSLYTYYIYLYRLPRFDSQNYISYIYNSKNRLQALKEIMILKQNLDKKSFPTNKSEQTIKKIAISIGVDKRPYLIIKRIK